MGRHPTAWRPDMARMRMRMAEVLTIEGVPYPHVAAAALAARGALGLGVACFATLLDVDEALVVAVEGGSVHTDALPQPMQTVLALAPSPTWHRPPT